MTPPVIRAPIRLSVHLTREDAERLRELAVANNCTVSEIVRCAIAEDKATFAQRVQKAQDQREGS